MLVTGGLGDGVERLRVHIALALTSDKRYTNYSADPPKKPNYLHFYVYTTVTHTIGKMNERLC